MESEVDGRQEGEGREEERDEKGKKGGHTMTSPPSYAAMYISEQCSSSLMLGAV